MILDKFRLQLEIDNSTLSQDIKDTLEFFLNFEDCGPEIDQLKKDNDTLKKENEELKKKLAPKVEGEKNIEAKFDSTCKLCGGPTKKGSRVLWTPGVQGVKHVPGECATSPM